MKNYNNEYHPEWQNLRINYIKRKLTPDFFKGKTLLELAPFNGYIGYSFFECGAEVTCIEGRDKNVIHIKENFPQLNCFQDNLDVDYWKWGYYDIIINMGFFYHLEKYHRQHLINSIKHCKLMIFESVINNSLEPIIQYTKENGSDQSLTDVGGEPSISWIENIFRENNCQFMRCNDIGNSNLHRYDGHGAPKYNRAMWIVTTQMKEI